MTPLKWTPFFQRYSKISMSWAQAMRRAAGSTVHHTRCTCYPSRCVLLTRSAGWAMLQSKVIHHLCRLCSFARHTQGWCSSLLWLLMGRGNVCPEPHHSEGTFIWEVHSPPDSSSLDSTVYSLHFLSWLGYGSPALIALEVTASFT